MTAINAAPAAPVEGQRDDNIDRAWLAGGGVLGLIGAVTSFQAVMETVRPSFGALSPLVPIGVDIGIAVFTAADLRMARRGWRTWWLRWVHRALSVGTIYLNVADEPHMTGKVAHGLLVGLWIVYVAIVAHIAKKRANLEGRARMDRIRWARWVLALPSTSALWRRMVLWEITDYGDALEREKVRRRALMHLRRTGGGPVRWRWMAPAEERVEYQVGNYEAVLSLRHGDYEPEDDEPGEPQPAPSSNGHQPPVEVPEVEIPEKMWADACALVDGHFEGLVPGRQRFMPVLRAQHGHKASSKVAEELMRRLKARQETAA